MEGGLWINLMLVFGVEAFLDLVKAAKIFLGEGEELVHGFTL